ncbi:hypothetical protein NP234_24995, partial [Salmonella enterica]|nr:hypothetical protein [Salmonella enterica]
KLASAMRTAVMAVAVMALLSALVLPHHHHAGHICLAKTEYHFCQHDGESDSSAPGTPCIEKEAFVAAKKATATRSTTIAITPRHAAPTEAPAPDCAPAGKATATTDCALPTSPSTASHGLRAPPAA